jgi:hypothetical protein
MNHLNSFNFHKKIIGFFMYFYIESGNEAENWTNLMKGDFVRPFMKAIKKPGNWQLPGFGCYDRC